MRLARCEKGHYYDKDKFTECPHCNGMQIAPGETVAFEDPNKPKPAPEPEKPKVQVEERVAFSVTEAKNESSFVVEEPAKEEPKAAAPEPAKEEPKADDKAGQPLDEMTTLSIEEEPEVAGVVEEVKAEPVPEPVKEEPKVEAPKPEPTPEPVKEEPKVEEVKAEPVKEEPKANVSSFVIEDDASASDSSSSLQNALDSVSSDDAEEADVEDKNSNPVIGWLICIDGIHKGKSFDVKEGRNLIGRSMAMDISLSGNSKIQRERHAIVTYDPRSKTCFFQLEDSRELVYINDDLVLGPTKFNHNDVISMADEQFVFLKLTCDKVDWV